MNPIQMLKNMMGKMNPKQVAMNMMKNNCNPVMKNIITMAESGDTKGLEQFAKNMMKERGQDFDKEFNDFMNNFK